MLLLFEVTGKAEGTVDAVEFYDAALDKMCSTQERTHTSPYAFITHYITLFLSFSLSLSPYLSIFPYIHLRVSLFFLFFMHNSSPPPPHSVGPDETGV